jgi:ketosteroid isomerase-like protein
MGEQDNLGVIERYWKAFGAKDLDAAYELLHEDYVQEWPQSGERIRGRDNAMAISRNYPGMPSFDHRRTVGGGDIVVSEVTLDYGQGPVYGCNIFEIRDGKIARETDYFADPFEAPEWRSQWVEKM